MQRILFFFWTLKFDIYLTNLLTINKMNDSEQIIVTRNFLTRLWHLENNERPGFIIGYVGPRVKGGEPARSELFSTGGPDTVRDRLLNPDKFLQAQLIEIEAQLRLRGDFVPSLCPALGVIGIPSAFGCEVTWFENNLPAVRPIIGNQLDQVFDLPNPSIIDGKLGRILEYTRYFIQQTNRRFPIRLTDIQGPLDSAALIMGHNNLLLAMHTHPAAVHHLLQLVTNLTIEFARTQRNIVTTYGVEFIPSMFQPWMPDGWGISVSNDEWVSISSEMHDEFSVPYLNQVSDAFGGIYIHSCGNWQHQFNSLGKVRNLRGLEFGASETSYEAVFEYFGGQVVLAPRVGFNREIKFDGMTDYVKKLLNASKTYRGLFLNVDITNGLIDERWLNTDLEEIYNLFDISD
jgi:hypothetical protein